MSENGMDRNFEAYTNFNEVESNKFQAISKAIDSYELLEADHHQSGGTNPNRAIEARASIRRAAKMLLVEIDVNKDNEPYDEIYERWTGDGGFIDEFKDLDLELECPEWLDDFLDDIRRASWELGYYRAGRKKPADPEDDEVQVRELMKQ